MPSIHFAIRLTASLGLQNGPALGSDDLVCLIPRAGLQYSLSSHSHVAAAGALVK